MRRNGTQSSAKQPTACSIRNPAGPLARVGFVRTLAWIVPKPNFSGTTQKVLC